MGTYKRRMKAVADFYAIPSRTGGSSKAMSFSVDASDLKKVARRFRELGFQQRHDVLRQALNHSGDKAFTKVRKAISDEGGFKVGAANRNMRKIRAHGGSHKNSSKSLGGYGALTYQIVARGEKIRVNSSNFRNVQWKRQWKGARWTPKGGRREDPGSFMIYGKTKTTRGVVVERRGSARLPLETRMQTGPAVLMPQVNAIGIAQQELEESFMPRVFHEVDRRLKRGKAAHRL